MHGVVLVPTKIDNHPFCEMKIVFANVQSEGGSFNIQRENSIWKLNNSSRPSLQGEQFYTQIRKRANRGLPMYGDKMQIQTGSAEANSLLSALMNFRQSLNPASKLRCSPRKHWFFPSLFSASLRILHQTLAKTAAAAPSQHLDGYGVSLNVSIAFCKFANTSSNSV